MNFYRKLIPLFLLSILSECKKTESKIPAPGELLDYEILSVTNNPKPKLGAALPSASNSTIFQKGTNLESLERNTLACYTYYWQETIKNMSEKNQRKGQKIIEELAGNIRIKPMSDNIAIVTWPRHGMSELDEIRDVQDIWVLAADTWHLRSGIFIPGQRATTLDFNGDGYDDIMLEGGCCDTTGISIFLNDKDLDVRYIQHFAIIGRLEDNFKPNCQASLKVIPYQSDKQSKSLKFNCKTNRFD